MSAMNIGSFSISRVVELEQVHTLVTELSPKDPAVAPFREKGVRVL